MKIFDTVNPGGQILKKSNQWKKVRLAGLALLALTLPVVMYMGQQVQETRQQAQVTSGPISVSPTPYLVSSTAAKFDGKSARIEISYKDSSRSAQVKAPYTMEAWIYPEKSGNDIPTVISSIANPQLPNCRAGATIYLNEEDSGFKVMGGTDHVDGVSNGGAINVQSKPFAYNAWYHIALVVDESFNVNTFVNGKLITSVPTKSDICSANLGYNLGASLMDWGEINTSSIFKGLIDNVHITFSAKYHQDFNPPPKLSRDNFTDLSLDFENGFGGINHGGVQLVNTRIPVTPSVKPSTIPNPTIAATPVCKAATLTNYAPSFPCNTSGRLGLRLVSYTCSDGYSGKFGSQTSCKTMSEWKEFASAECNKRKVCLIPTRPPISPTPTPTIVSGGKLTGVVFLDANNNGKFDANETRITGAQISVVKMTSNSAGISAGKVTTGADGTYQFTNLDNKISHRVLVSVPGYTQTTSTMYTVSAPFGIISHAFGFAPMVTPVPSLRAACNSDCSKDVNLCKQATNGCTVCNPNTNTCTPPLTLTPTPSQ